MSDQYLVASKRVRKNFTAKLHYDQMLGKHDNPRMNRDNLTRLHLWGSLETMSDSPDISNYQQALHEMYRQTYPELIDYILEEDPPEEIADLIDQTPYKGIYRWLTVLHGQEVQIEMSMHVDINEEEPDGVVFISNEALKKEEITREEGEIFIENDIKILSLYINRSVYYIEIRIDGEREATGGIYPLEGGEKVGRQTRMRDTCIPTDEYLDEYLLELASNDEDKKLIKTTEWELQ